jgi:hypothetical protein
MCVLCRYFIHFLSKAWVHHIDVSVLPDDFFTSWQIQWNYEHLENKRLPLLWKNGQVVPVHVMKSYRGNRGIALLILNLRTGCRCVGWRWGVAFSPLFSFFIVAILHFKLFCTMKCLWLNPQISVLEASLGSDSYSLLTTKYLMALVTENNMCYITTSCNGTCCNYTRPSVILVVNVQSGKIQPTK